MLLISARPTVCAVWKPNEREKTLGEAGKQLRWWCTHTDRGFIPASASLNEWVKALLTRFYFFFFYMKCVHRPLVWVTANASFRCYTCFDALDWSSRCDPWCGKGWTQQWQWRRCSKHLRSALCCCRGSSSSPRDGEITLDSIKSTEIQFSFRVTSRDR